MDYDLKIVGGTVIDGTGAERRRADVAVANGRIAAVGHAPGPARETIGAEGRIVAPGFIDIHTHYDAQVIWDPMLTVSPWHGVTTAVMGNCGFGIAPARPGLLSALLRMLESVEGMSFEALEAGLAGAEIETFPRYLDAIERRGVAINVAAMIGHSAVRLAVMGRASAERAARPDEVSAMADIVREAVAAGALGFSTSSSPLHVGFDGLPVPSRLADLNDETVKLAEAARGGVVQATSGFVPGFDDYAALARASGGTVSWTALLTQIGSPDRHRRDYERAMAQRAGGLAVVPQVACRPLMFEIQMSAPFPFERLASFGPVSAADRAGKARLYADPAFRAAARRELDPATPASEPARNFREAFAGMRVSDCAADRGLNGRAVAELAAARGVHPFDLVLDLALASGMATRFHFPLANTDEDGVAELLRLPHTVLGLSDAGAHASQICDACFSTHLLGHWVRDKAALSLEQAIDHLCARPARTFGIRGRGRLAPGWAADIVVFDPATVAPGPLERVRDLPGGADRLIARPAGIEAVIVNGTVLRRDGEDRVDPARPLPGRLLRRGRA